MFRYMHSRPFLLSFFSTLIVILLVFGLFAVDAEGRRLSFNDTSPAMEIVYFEDKTARLQINAFSIDRQIDITPFVKIWHFIADFFCLPHARFPQPDISVEDKRPVL